VRPVEESDGGRFLSSCRYEGEGDGSGSENKRRRREEMDSQRASFDLSFLFLPSSSPLELNSLPQNRR